MALLTKSQWAARNAAKKKRAAGFARTVEAARDRSQLVPQAVAPTFVSAAPCELRGCLQWPTTHSHTFRLWPDPRASSKYQWEGKTYQDPPNLTSEWTTAPEGMKCAAPRTRCKVQPGDPVLRRKETGDLFCRKHGHFAVHGLPGSLRWERLVQFYRDKPKHEKVSKTQVAKQRGEVYT